jgi:hypothetical protein
MPSPNQLEYHSHQHSFRSPVFFKRMLQCFYTMCTVVTRITFIEALSFFLCLGPSFLEIRDISHVVADIVLAQRLTADDNRTIDRRLKGFDVLNYLVNPWTLMIV